MHHQKFALRLLVIVFSVALVVFAAEAVWDFMYAVDPDTGQALTLSTFYVLSFIAPLTIIKRVHLSLMDELAHAARGRSPVKQSQQRVHLRIINLGSMLQRSVDRADRDVAFDAIRAHTLDLARV